MMKIMMYMLFLIPLCFKSYWLIQFFLLFLCFIMMFSFNFSLNYENLSYFLGLDSMSYFFVFLSIWISSLMFMASSKIYLGNNYYKEFSIVILILLMSLVMVFSSMNLFMFYVFFEVSLMPLVIIIMGWGYQPERLMAGLYMIFYTIFFSFPMLVGLFLLYSEFSSLMFFEMSYIDGFMIYFLVNLVFFVKIPLYTIHLWLPKAHVEAPVSGSMILAGVVLKLGGYGLIRLMKIFMNKFVSVNLVIIVISLFGSLIVSLICLSQTDMKALIAYSSVSHMGMVLASILTVSLLGFKGSFIMMLAHGLCSSALFSLANIYYERLNNRSLYMVKGMINILPNIGFFMFMFCVINMAAPPSLNLLGEIFMMKSLVAYSGLNTVILGLVSFFSAVYSIYLYSFSNHGKFTCTLFNFFGGLSREYLLLILHLFPLMLMIFISDMIIMF